MYKEALAYLDMGWSIIPTGDDKKPLISWKKFQDELPTKEDIENWFGKNNQFGSIPNIGLVTGKISKVTVVDIEEGGKTDDLPKTLISKTGGNGFHYFYKYEDGIKNSVRTRELTDIRNDGGYVILPPSKSTKGDYKWFNVSNLVPFPNNIFNIKKTKQKDTQQLNINIPEYTGLSEGGRNEAIVKYIGKILPLIHPLDWDTIAWEKVVEANKKNNPPLPEDEIRTTFDYIKRSEKTNPSVRIAQPIIQDDDNDADILPISEVAASFGTEELQTFSTGFKDFDDVMMGGFKEGDLIITTAPTGCGKTTLSQTFTYNICNTGVPCLFFSYEVIVRNIWDKFQQMGANTDHLIFSPRRISSGTIEWLEKKILDGIQKYGVKFVVVDHLGFLLPRKTGFHSQLSANEASFLGMVCRDLKTLAIKNNIIINLLVHVKKTDKPTINDIKGSSAIAQEADHVFILDRPQNEDKNIDEVYSSDAYISLAKNRLTGMTPRILCHLVDAKLKKKFNMDLN